MTRNTSWSGNRTSFPKATRKQILAQNPICVICHTRPATIADHEPSYAELIRAGIPNPHHPKYGQGVCQPCHDTKTRAEQRRGSNRWRPTPEPHPGLT